MPIAKAIGLHTSYFGSIATSLLKNWIISHKDEIITQQKQQIADLKEYIELLKTKIQ